ncbi:MAG TPA: hypothetical protein VFT22_32770 [Kofleriaceae bacterium]|nr:hypothetical protein [Kofleriaceae bacterium]
MATSSSGLPRKRASDSVGLGMRIAAFLVSCVIWVRVASAAPGVITAPRVDVYLAPSEVANVDSQLVSGDPVCVVDRQDDPSGAHPGWLAIRRAGGIGFVRGDAVDLRVTSPAAAQRCEDAARGPVDPSAPAAGTFMPRHPVRISLGFGLGATWLREQAAVQHHIGSLAANINGTLGLTLYDLVTISGLGGGALPADHASFSQDVMPLGGGDPTTQTSHLEVQNWSIAGGLRTPFLILRTRAVGVFAGALFADAGWSYIHGIRSIEHCINCRKEDLDLASGSFWRAGFDLASDTSTPRSRIRASWGLSVAYQRYDGDAGLIQALTLGFTIWVL